MLVGRESQAKAQAFNAEGNSDVKGIICEFSDKGTYLWGKYKALPSDFNRTSWHFMLQTVTLNCAGWLVGFWLVGWFLFFM